MKPVIILLFCFISISSIQCIQADGNHHNSSLSAAQSSQLLSIINPNGNTTETRFHVPDGFERVPVAKHSFADYLRHLPLKKAGSKVRYYNGKEKDDDAYIAVVDMDISPRNLQQCADAVMRLRGEFFYRQKEYDSISFTLTNGFTADYTKWMAGNRIIVKGNHTDWVQTAAPSNTYNDFRNFMNVVFTYAGTLSLSKTLHSKNIRDISIGDVFIVGGSPGHAVIVTDVAQNKTGEKVFMLAQSYMPAQETQVLRNLNDESISPWYINNFTGNLATPEWTFTKEQLKMW